MTTQLDQWRGDFGRAYTDRNQVDWRTRVQWFRDTLGPLNLQSVIEVGCNRGHNLIALNEAIGPGVHIAGIEPNVYAANKAADACHGIGDVTVAHGDLLNMLVWKRHRFGLVFTSGVLIHIAPQLFDESLRRIYSFSARYILAIEYYAAEDTEREYRGMQNMLWARDYGSHYLRLFPDLRLIGTGELTPDSGFADHPHYWLLEKT